MWQFCFNPFSAAVKLTAGDDKFSFHDCVEWKVLVTQAKEVVWDTSHPSEGFLSDYLRPIGSSDLELWIGCDIWLCKWMDQISWESVLLLSDFTCRFGYFVFQYSHSNNQIVSWLFFFKKNIISYFISFDFWMKYV